MRGTEALEAGWDALAQRRWEAARSSFREALAVEETPEAFEGLSWAAWWLDDGDAVFRARERAFGLYRKRGRPASAARMATWLAADQLDFHGAAAVASGWFRRAHRLLDPLEPGPDHGWLAFHEGYVAYGEGDTDRARKHAARVEELGRRFGVPDLEMLGLALQGAAQVACAEVEEGMRRLDEAAAMALAEETTVPISGAWACCFLVTACEVVRDFPRAFEWCDRIAEFARRHGSRYMLAFCRTHYANVHLWRGRWAEAEAELEAAVEDYGRSRPAYVPEALVVLAELRRRQGRREEAARLLDDAGGSSAARLCRARIALDDGEPLRAAELLERVLRRVPEERELARASALELLVRTRALRGERAEAARALEDLRTLARVVGTVPLRASADLAEGVLLSVGGESERARRMLEDALDLFEQCGAPYEAAQARTELAAALRALGRSEEAEREADAAARSLSELGADSGALGTARPTAAGTRPVTAPGLERLTRRERQVLELVAQGLTNLQIAERLVLSEHTVHRHVTHILRKLDLPSRTAAAVHAVRSGFFAPTDP